MSKAVFTPKRSGADLAAKMFGDDMMVEATRCVARNIASVAQTMGKKLVLLQTWVIGEVLFANIAEVMDG